MIPKVRAPLARFLLPVLLMGCAENPPQQSHWAYVTTSGETLTRDAIFDEGGLREEAARRSGAHDLPCPLEGTRAHVINGRPTHIVVDGCGERIVYAEEYAYGTHTYSYIAVARFRP